jgi:hypothetical protein
MVRSFRVHILTKSKQPCNWRAAQRDFIVVCVQRVTDTNEQTMS